MADNILVMEHITKEFPGVKALDNVNLEVQRGEIHALIGENGAGKSTLMNVLSGQYPYGSYTGTVTYEGEECKFKKLNDSEAKGIVIIHQELALIPLLSIGENMFLGNEIKNKRGAIDWDKTYSEAEKHMAQVGLHESAQTLIKDIGTGKQQLVEIAKAFSKDVKLLILDEPTSSLNDEDAKMLLDLLMEFKKQGLTSIIITHKLNEIIYCADRCTILRDGSTIETLTKGVDDLSEDRIIKGMVGRPMEDRYPKREHNVSKEVMLEVKNWTVHHPLYPEKIVDDNISFKVHKGEVVGFSGLQGAGRTELAMSIFGKSYGYRNFRITNGRGEELVLANSVWVYMDMERMRPMRIPEKVADAYRPEIGEELSGEWGARKLSVPEGGTEMPPVPVAGFFIDTNHHMNNGKYILVAKESVPEDFAIGGVRAEYRRAAMLGDVLHPVVAVAEEKITVVLTDGGDQIYAIVEFAAAEKN